MARRSFLIDLIASLAIRLLNLFAEILPISFMLMLGRRIGGLIYLFNMSLYRSRIAYQNMRAAFCNKKSPREIRKLLKSMFVRLGETFAEILSLTKVDSKYVDHYITVENMDYLRNSVKENKGIIFLTAHFGNWELSAIVGSIRGYPLYVLARQQSMTRCNELLNRMRESKGLKVIRKGIATRLLAKALHEGKIVGMVADQDSGKTGKLADYFGRPASTASGPYRFAAKTGAIIQPAFIVRTKGPYHRLILEKPIRVKGEDDILRHIEAYNNMLEHYVTQHPDHWLWLHRRWKSSPLKKIVILSDGKAGHLNQSLSIAEHFRRYRSEKDIKEEYTGVEIIEIRFRNKFSKAIANICGIFSGPRCQGCMFCIKFLLQKSSYEKLIHTYADVVISTGFSLSGVNSVYKYENNAKNAVSMKPGFLSFRKFDLVILPKHDVRKLIKRENVIITDGVPNVINKKYLEKSAEAVSGMIRMENAVSLGILLGGNNANFEYTEGDILKLISDVLNVSGRINADILCTTSRRTGKTIESIVKEKLKNEPRCKFLVIANEKNISHALGGILAYSDIVIVSGESASMVSEAVSSGKRTIVFKGKKKKSGYSKHEAFLDNLLNAGCFELADMNNLADVVYNVYKGQKPFKAAAASSDEWIYKNMWRLGG